jgi:serine/threonine protein kinase
MRNAEEIVAAAMRIGAAEERQSFIENACSGDASLLRKVESLLNSDPETLASLGMTTDMERAPRGRPSLSEGPGASIGPYKLVRIIGAGGMGTVWLAEQEYPLRREVALKIIKPGMDSGDVIRRFEAERQTLAMMDHPNIAKVLDAGTTGAGRPYFAMELVHGVPITVYCDEHRLGPRERLELLVPVCRAIQHAHQKGIIHRDIKPSNVLVSTYDGRPTPKVIDFGIAKATGAGLIDSQATRLGIVVGTFEYMSPEQAETGGGDTETADIDTRSDIYSLGVVMYELLTGRTPLRWAEALKAGYVEILRRIREDEPQTPSSRLTTSPETLVEVAGRRGTEPAKLPKLLRGELDWIVMKAIEKDRARRYETANGLARDIERYLNGEPVEASPVSTTYRLRKFASKHRVLIATAAGFLALLIAGVLTSTWQAVRARRAEQTALQQRDRADTEAATARAVTDFIEKDLLGQASPENQARPDQKPDPDLTVRTALDRAAAKIASAFPDKPLVQASIRQTIGTAYTDLGLYQQARPHLETALKLRLANLPPDDIEVANAKEALATLLVDQGNSQAALPLVQDVLAIKRKKLGPDDSETLVAANNVAAVISMEGRKAEAEPLLRQVLEARSRKLGRLDPETLLVMGNLAENLTDEGKTAEAEPLFQEAVRGYRQAFGPDHPKYLWVLAQLGVLYSTEHKFPEAETVFREVLEKRSRTLGPDHPDTAFTMEQLAVAIAGQHRYPEAEELHRRVLAIDRKVLGPFHPNTLDTLHSMAVNYQDEKKYPEAEAAYTEVIGLRRQAHGESSQDYDQELAALGTVRLELHKFAAAEPVLRECLAIRQKQDPNGYRYFNAESVLGGSLAGQGKYSQAEPLLLSGYQGMQQLGAKLPEIGKPRFQRAGERIVALYEAWGKPDKASEWRAKLKAMSP